MTIVHCKLSISNFQSAMPESSAGSGDERIRKVVGSGLACEDPIRENPIRRVWKLRERMLRLGIDFGNDDERIRKVVGGPQRGER